MNDREALILVEKMYHANGMEKGARLMAELAKEVALASCGSCAKAVVQAAHDNGPALNVPSFRTQYRREYSSPDHGLHIGVDEAAVDVGAAEARWRSEVPARFKDAGMEPRRAQIAAAMAWASGLRIEFVLGDDPAAWLRHTPRGVISETTVAAAWTYARAVATTDPCDMTDEEWDSAVEPWREAWREAS